MRVYGDLPPEDRRQLYELIELERLFSMYGSGIPSTSKAMGFVAMAHDYYMMEMDEEGDRLLKAAELYCPGYFIGPIHSHMAKERDFSSLVNQLKNSLGYELMVSFGFSE